MNKKGIILLEFLLTLTIMGILIAPVLITLHAIRITTESLQSEIKIQNQLNFFETWLDKLLSEKLTINEIGGDPALVFTKVGGNKLYIELHEGVIRKREFGLISPGIYKSRPHYGKPLTYFKITELKIEKIDEKTLKFTLKNDVTEHTFIKKINQ